MSRMIDPDMNMFKSGFGAAGFPISSGFWQFIVSGIQQMVSTCGTASDSPIYGDTGK